MNDKFDDEPAMFRIIFNEQTTFTNPNGLVFELGYWSQEVRNQLLDAISTAAADDKNGLIHAVGKLRDLVINAASSFPMQIKADRVTDARTAHDAMISAVDAWIGGTEHRKQLRQHLDRTKAWQDPASPPTLDGDPLEHVTHWCDHDYRGLLARINAVLSDVQQNLGIQAIDAHRSTGASMALFEHQYTRSGTRNAEVNTTWIRLQEDLLNLLPQDKMALLSRLNDSSSQHGNEGHPGSVDTLPLAIERITDEVFQHLGIRQERCMDRRQQRPFLVVDQQKHEMFVWGQRTQLDPMHYDTVFLFCRAAGRGHLTMTVITKELHVRDLYATQVRLSRIRKKFNESVKSLELTAPEWKFIHGWIKAFGKKLPCPDAAATNPKNQWLGTPDPADVCIRESVSEPDSQ